MSEPKRFRYPRIAMFKDYGQAAAGAMIFSAPLVFAWGNVFVAVVLGGIVLMFLSFGWSTWRRHGSVIAITDEGIWTEGARQAMITWAGIDRVELRYFSTRRERGRTLAGEEGSGWMQLRLDGEGATIRIDSALDGFNEIAREVADATDRHDLKTTPVTKGNFVALGLAPNSSWAGEA
jgi:hypothetical protein